MNVKFYTVVKWFPFGFYVFLHQRLTQQIFFLYDTTILIIMIHDMLVVLGMQCPAKKFGKIISVSSGQKTSYVFHDDTTSSKLV